MSRLEVHGTILYEIGLELIAHTLFGYISTRILFYTEIRIIRHRITTNPVAQDFSLIMHANLRWKQQLQNSSDNMWDMRLVLR